MLRSLGFVKGNGKPPKDFKAMSDRFLKLNLATEWEMNRKQARMREKQSNRTVCFRRVRF